MDVLDDPFARLGARLKATRLESKKTLREMAQEFNVSATFLSQLENGKSKPSVATLYSLAKALNVNMDSLLSNDDAESVSPKTPSPQGVGEQVKGLADIWADSKGRISTTTSTNRTVLTLDSGVTWERLAAVTEAGGHFVEVVYHPGAETSADGGFITHEGYEYGYALEGDLEMTIGDFVFTLAPANAFGFDSSIPHKFKNTGTVDFRGIWFVHGCQGRPSN
jgi:transcriptional regulator with XRE-family HTH domain